MAAFQRFMASSSPSQLGRAGPATRRSPAHHALARLVHEGLCSLRAAVIFKSLLENSGGPGEAAGHDDDHGPVNAGFVVSGQAFVVADGAAVAGDPGQCPLCDPPAGQDFEGVQVIGPSDDFQLQFRLEHAGGPGDEFPGVAAVGPGQPDGGEGAAQVPQQRPGSVAVLD